MERRVLIAISLSFVVLFLFQRFVMPPAPPPQAVAPAAQSAQPPAPVTQTPQAPGQPAPPGSLPQASSPAQPAAPVAGSAAPELTVGDQSERDVTVETRTVRAVFTNRGGRVRHWVLKAYRNDLGVELDLVPEGAGPDASKPFSLAVDDPALTARLNGALYRVSGATGDRVDATAQAATIGFEMAAADGVVVKKSFTFQPDGYIVSMNALAEQGGKRLNPWIQWGPGLGDDIARAKPASFLSPSYNTPAQAIVHNDGKVQRIPPATTGGQDGAFRYVGIDDHYFVSMLLNTGDTPVPLRFEYVPVVAPVAGSPAQTARYVSYAVRFSTPQDSMRFFFGPKALDELRAIDPEVVRVINFGMFAWLAVPLLGALKWVHGFVGNWGWSIVTLTMLINLAMFPLRHKSVVSMRRMQEIQPQMKAIQDRYAKFKITDPERQKMNSEVMELYKAKGVNPASGCVPMLLTMPFLFAFYSMLSQAIEIRGAGFVGWITDLSRYDPLFITPVLMGATMFWQQRLTPSTMDPQQQKVMMFMPLMFLFMFLWAPSGLVIYWFVSNLWAIGQQYFTNYLIGPPVLAKAK